MCSVLASDMVLIGSMVVRLCSGRIARGKAMLHSCIFDVVVSSGHCDLMRGQRLGAFVSVTHPEPIDQHFERVI